MANSADSSGAVPEHRDEGDVTRKFHLTLDELDDRATRAAERLADKLDKAKLGVQHAKETLRNGNGNGKNGNGH